MVCVGGGIPINHLVGASAWCVRGLASGGGRGGVMWGLHCWWGGQAWVCVVLVGSLGVPLGRLGVACACRAVLAVPGWLRCLGLGGRRPHWHLGGAVVRR